VPTKLDRFLITVPDDLKEFLAKDAEMNSRPLATHITHICKEYWWEKQREAKLINPEKADGAAPTPIHYGRRRLQGPESSNEADVRNPLEERK